MLETQPIYFKSLNLINVKCFEKATVDLCDKDGAISPWTLVLGDNGVGKTTILKCLAWMAPVIYPLTTEEEQEKKKEDNKKTLEQIQADDQTRIKPSIDDLEDEREFEKLIRVGANISAEISASFAFNTSLGEVPVETNVVEVGISFERQGGKLTKVEPHKQFVKEFNTPIMFAYGANRRMGSQNLKDQRLQDPISNLFLDSGTLYDPEEVLSTLEYASLKPESHVQGTKLFNKVKKVLYDLLPDIQSPEFFRIASPLASDGSIDKSRVEVTTPYGEVPISALSLGYQTMIAWILDLAIRMVWEYGDSDNPLEQPAVVIIDEIDLHLHPKWQRDLRDFLTLHFKKTQFICTAHSPFVAQASAADNFSVLHRQNTSAIVQNDPVVVKSWRIGQFATSELFDIASERGKDIEAKVNRRRVLLDNGNRNAEEESELQALDKELAVLPVDAEGPTKQLLQQLEEFSALVKAGGNKL